MKWLLSKKWLNNNQGERVLEMITALDIAYAVTIIKNQELVWEQDRYKDTLGDEKQEMHDNYKNLEELEDRDKYFPKIPRFSGGVRVKRTFGSVMWNKKGMIFPMIQLKYGRRQSAMIVVGIG